MMSRTRFNCRPLQDPESRKLRHTLARDIKEARAAQWQQVLLALRFRFANILRPSIARGTRAPAAAEPLGKQAVVCVRQAIQDAGGELPPWLWEASFDVFWDAHRVLAGDDPWIDELRAYPLNKMQEGLSQETQAIMQEVLRLRAQLEAAQGVA